MKILDRKRLLQIVLNSAVEVKEKELGIIPHRHILLVITKHGSIVAPTSYRTLNACYRDKEIRFFIIKICNIRSLSKFHKKQDKDFTKTSLPYGDSINLGGIGSLIPMEFDNILPEVAA